MIFAISTQTTLSLSYSKLEYSPSRNLNSNTSAGKSSLCFSESWFGEGNLKLGLPETRLASESSTQNTPWNSTLSSAETAKAKVPKTQSTPNTGQRYPDLDAPKLCWILMQNFLLPISYLFTPLPLKHQCRHSWQRHNAQSRPVYVLYKGRQPVPQ